LRIAIDDFGTGYSSLSYLKELAIHTLKIDKSFVEAIGEDERTKAIVSAIITMAHSLGLKAVAEGVETETQLGHLWALGCDAWQGFHFHKPMPHDQFTELLRRGAKAQTLSCRLTEDMLLHVSSIDNQHRELCNRIDELSKAIWNGVKPKELSDFVDFLHDYVRLHFNDEQRLMQKVIVHRDPPGVVDFGLLAACRAFLVAPYRAGFSSPIDKDSKMGFG